MSKLKRPKNSIGHSQSLPRTRWRRLSGGKNKLKNSRSTRKLKSKFLKLKRRKKLVNHNVPPPEHEEKYQDTNQESIYSEDLIALSPLGFLASQGSIFQTEHIDLINWLIVLQNE